MLLVALGRAATCRVIRAYGMYLLSTLVRMRRSCRAHNNVPKDGGGFWTFYAQWLAVVLANYLSNGGNHGVGSFAGGHPRRGKAYLKKPKLLDEIVSHC